MEQFMRGERDDYDSTDGFRHELLFSRRLGTISSESNSMTTSCIACGARRTDKYSEKHTEENELIAIEVAHWQINHREKCQIPTGAITIN